MLQLKQIKDKSVIDFTHKFMNEVSKELKRDFMYIITGSLAKGKYIHGKSDIDLVVVPKKGVISPYAYLWMNDFGRKYGTVYKKGRVIGIFDVMIFITTKLQTKFRKEFLLKENNSIKIYYTGDKNDKTNL